MKDDNSTTYSDINSENDTNFQLNPKIKDNNIELSISLLLTKIIEKNKTNPNYKKIIKRQNKLFLSKKIPKISILEYLYRITKYTYIEKSTLISSLIYIDRLINENVFFLTYYNVHKILIICIILSIKYNEDDIFGNDYYSEISGISLKELNKLEYEVFKYLKFNFYIKPEEYKIYEEYLDNYCYNNI
jgi:hypothetical protein